MKTIVLFGGDRGGLMLTDKGVVPIPPFDLGIRLTLKSAAAMVNGAAIAKDVKTQRMMAHQAMGLCNMAVEQIEEVVGPLDADRSLIFQDDNGGFSCGSTGKAPIPLPWPPPSPSLQELITDGVVEADLIELVKQARANKIELAELFEKPMDAAKTLGLTLSQKSANNLNLLAPSKLGDIEDATAREVLAFFHKVAEDGRFLDIMLSRPYEVSRELKVPLSEEALELLLSRGGLFLQRGVNLAVPAIIAIIAIAIAIIYLIQIVLEKWPATPEIKDRSGKKKI